MTTAPGLPAPLTPQEAFDIAAPALLKQGRRSMLPPAVGICAYRSADGLKCAIGHLIPDAEYQPYWEGKEGFYVSNHCHALSELPTAFVLALQHIHDKDPVKFWKASLSTFALRWGLQREALEIAAPGRPE